MISRPTVITDLSNSTSLFVELKPLLRVFTVIVRHWSLLLNWVAVYCVVYVIALYAYAGLERPATWPFVH